MEGVLSMMDVVIMNYALHYNPENGQTFVRARPPARPLARTPTAGRAPVETLGCLVPCRVGVNVRRASSGSAWLRLTALKVFLPPCLCV